jgi:hypothetical protein
LYVFFSRLAPVLAPLVRWLGSRRTEALLRPIERAAKGFMFDCHSCGQCVLSATGMACPMNCPKQMRNGPCGGVRADGTCEVDPQMRCVWVEATEGTKRIAADHLAHPTPLLPAIDTRNAAAPPGSGSSRAIPKRRFSRRSANVERRNRGSVRSRRRAVRATSSLRSS